MLTDQQNSLTIFNPRARVKGEEYIAPKPVTLVEMQTYMQANGELILSNLNDLTNPVPCNGNKYSSAIEYLLYITNSGPNGLFDIFDRFFQNDYLKGEFLTKLSQVERQQEKNTLPFRNRSPIQSSYPTIQYDKDGVYLANRIAGPSIRLVRMNFWNNDNEGFTKAQSAFNETWPIVSAVQNTLNIMIES